MVQKLAKEEEPYQQRFISVNDKGNESPRSNSKKNRTEQSRRAGDVAQGGLYARGSRRSPTGCLVGEQTMSAALKNKYIVRSRHSVLCQDRFVPVNKDEAKLMVKKPTVHDNGVDQRDAAKDISEQMRMSVHGTSNFILTSPVSQDI